MTCPHPVSRKTENAHEWECRKCGERYIQKPSRTDFSGVLAPVKKRGSSKFNSAPTEAHVRDAVRATRQRLGARFTRGAAEREIWRHSVGAGSQKKFAHLQQAGREELQRVMDPKNQPNFKAEARTAGEEPAGVSRENSRGGNRE